MVSIIRLARLWQLWHDVRPESATHHPRLSAPRIVVRCRRTTRSLRTRRTLREAVGDGQEAVTDDAIEIAHPKLDGNPVAIGAVILERSELRACYVSPKAARRGCGSAWVREIERVARENGLTRLELAGSLNAESFYAVHGYQVRE